MRIQSRVVYNVLFFVLAALLVAVVKPTLVFSPSTGEPRPVGVGERRTVFSLGVAIIILAAASHALFTVLDVAYASLARAPAPQQLQAPLLMPAWPPPPPTI